MNLANCLYLLLACFQCILPYQLHVEAANVSNATVYAHNRVYLAAILDTDTYYWAEEVLDLTISMINNHSDGLYDHIFAHDGTIVDFDLTNDQCDENVATRAYWALREKSAASNNNSISTNINSTSNENVVAQQTHGIIGSRCSGASISIARIAGLDGVPQISPVSTSALLSNKDEFPLFSRMVAPGNADGEVGALISLLRAFEWERVTVLHTDTQYARDVAAEFRKLWSENHTSTNAAENGTPEQWDGQIAYANTVSLTSGSSGDIDEQSVIQVLGEIPTSDPTVNSRIIVLVAQEEHAFPILKIATETGFQPDTIWVGLSWTGRDSPITTDWLPQVPGYLGIAPFRNLEQESVYLHQLRDKQGALGRKQWTEIPHYAVGYLVDSIVAMTTALSNLGLEDRNNGTLVTQAIRTLQFDGVTGTVTFSAKGDRVNPQYEIVNYQQLENGSYDWKTVGLTGVGTGSATIASQICFATLGCNFGLSRDNPSDRYPIPKAKLPLWVRLFVPGIVFLLIVFAIKYWRSNVSHKATLAELHGKLATLDDAVDEAVAKRNRLILERGALMDKPDTWIDSDRILVEVGPNDDEYWAVTDLLRETMDDAHISSLWRIQNVALWSYFTFHKHRLAINGIDTNETSVWHGTSSLDPSVIYDDQQDGFMMQYSRDGFWGRGIYFAEKSSYSHGYSYKPAARPASSVVDGRSVGKEDEHEMYLAKLLIGKHVFLDRDESSIKAAECRALTVPPINPRTNLKYNTVTGNTGGSQVWIVYENGRAYPEYLVRYYRGKRDPMRTPFPCKMDLSKDSISANVSDDDIEGGTSSGINGVTWEYSDSGAWIPYAKKHQIILESGYQQHCSSNSTVHQTITISTDAWTYEVDFVHMEQTNIKHQTHTKRGVRRRSVEAEFVA